MIILHFLIGRDRLLNDFFSCVVSKGDYLPPVYHFSCSVRCSNSLRLYNPLIPLCTRLKLDRVFPIAQVATLSLQKALQSIACLAAETKATFGQYMLLSSLTADIWRLSQLSSFVVCVTKKYPKRSVAMAIKECVRCTISCTAYCKEHLKVHFSGR